MADPTTDIFNVIFNGKTGGVPNIVIIIALAMLFFFIYLIVTRKAKPKEFKPLDMRKETKRRFKREYKYFGRALHKNIYDVNDADNPVAFAIGYMKVVEMEQMKRFEPIMPRIPKTDLDKLHAKNALEIYGVGYSHLNDVQKRNIDEVSKEEARTQKIEEVARNKKTKIVRGKKETEFSLPVPMYMFKICQPNILAKLLARFLNYGIDFAVFDKDQVKMEKDRITLTANFQRRTPFDIFVFSESGKNLVQDISYGQERENIWQETANQIPRAVHFDTEASKSLLYRREDSKLEREKRRAQSETREYQ